MEDDARYDENNAQCVVVDVPIFDQARFIDNPLYCIQQFIGTLKFTSIDAYF